jgi:DNA-binding MarR family transcriptional regulator
VETEAPAQIKEEDKPEESVVVSDGKTAQILVEEPPIDLHNNDTKVLSVLNEAGSNYSFKGLMRKLEMHQQSLSRALHRLEELGFVEKSEGGYRLIKGIPAKVEQKPMGREFVQLMQTYIPISMRAGELVRQLAGRWFKNLRWIGMIESNTGYTLQWASDDGTFQVNLRLVADYVIIETNALSEKEKVQAMVGSYAIYEQITRAMQSKVGAYSMNYRPQHN